MRILICGLLALFLTACSSDTEEYYRLHPMKLQEALKNCPQSAPQAMSCDTLAQLASQLNQLAYQLQSNPQGFGETILKSQEQLGRLEVELVHHQSDTALRARVNQEKRKIAEYLAVVKWLESPEK